MRFLQWERGALPVFELLNKVSSACRRRQKTERIMGNLQNLIVGHYDRILGRISRWLANCYHLPSGDRVTVAAAALNEIITPILNGGDGGKYSSLDEVVAAAKALAGDRAKAWLINNLGNRMRDF